MLAVYKPFYRLFFNEYNKTNFKWMSGWWISSPRPDSYLIAKELTLEVALVFELQIHKLILFYLLSHFSPLATVVSVKT